MTRKICVVVTARATYSRIRTALEAIHAHPQLELQLVAAASALVDRYGNVVRVIEADGLQPAARLYTLIEGENLPVMAKSTSLALAELSTVFDNLRPDFVVTVADRYETIATAIAAAYMNIPLVHIQGGEVTGSIDEKTRHAVTKLADYHFVASPMAAERVRRMGESPDRIYVTGCPSIDLAAEVLRNPTLDFDPVEKYGGVGPRFEFRQGYLVVLQHPVTTEYTQNRRHIEETLLAVKQLRQPTFWFWPNPDAGSHLTAKAIRVFRELNDAPYIHFFKNMDPKDFLRLVYRCKVLVGNSSVGIRECSYLGVPVVNIGSRQEGRERGRNVIDVPYEHTAIVEAVRYQMANGRYPCEKLYGDGQSGKRIADLLVRIPPVYEKRLAY